MEIHPDALTAAACVCDRQGDHLADLERYLRGVCDRPEAFRGVLSLFAGSYAGALTAATEGLGDAGRLAGSLGEGLRWFRDDVVATDDAVGARLARHRCAVEGRREEVLVRRRPAPAGSARSSATPVLDLADTVREQVLGDGGPDGHDAAGPGGTASAAGSLAALRAEAAAVREQAAAVADGWAEVGRTADDLDRYRAFAGSTGRAADSPADLLDDVRGALR